MKYVTPLNDAEIETLQQMHAYHPSRRARMRAHSLLLSHQHYSIPHIARIYQVDPRRVSAWIERWQAWGLVGLYDRPRSGRPAILNAEEQQHVYEYLDASPKDVRKVVEAIEQKTSKRVSTKTIKRLIKKSHLWKRIKKSPAQAPEPHKYQRSQEMIARLQARESQGACDLWYFDGAGFCLEPYLPYAWQPIGSSIKVPTSSHGRRLNVLGFLKRNNDLGPVGPRSGGTRPQCWCSLPIATAQSWYCAVLPSLGECSRSEPANGLHQRSHRGPNATCSQSANDRVRGRATARVCPAQGSDW